MVVVRRLAAALSVPLALSMAAQAGAQTTSAFPAGPTDFPPFVAPAQPTLPQFRMTMGDLRAPGEVPRNGLIAAYPVRENLQIGVGRFTVPELARPRTHMEADRAPTAARPRERGVAAVGLSIRF